ncbi:MAG TPA: gas vesicle protein [Pyrinomonadaceae bacterium]|jgi:hypothetical protein
MSVEEFEFGGEDELSLLETLDHVLDSGLVIAGEVTISVANIDLIYVGLNLLLGSVDTIENVLAERLDAQTPRRALSSTSGEDDTTRED